MQHAYYIICIILFFILTYNVVNPKLTRFISLKISRNKWDPIYAEVYHIIGIILYLIIYIMVCWWIDSLLF